jgi:hypothetical protein
MKHLEQYYRNLSEQLERQIAILEAKLKDKKKDKKGNKEKLADEDYDKDGELETSKEEHKGAVDKAIKKAIAKKKGVLKEGREFSTGNIVYGGFPRVMNESQAAYLDPVQSTPNSGALPPQKPTNLMPMDIDGNGIHDKIQNMNADELEALLASHEDEIEERAYNQGKHSRQYRYRDSTGRKLAAQASAIDARLQALRNSK